MKVSLEKLDRVRGNPFLSEIVELLGINCLEAYTVVGIVDHHYSKMMALMSIEEDRGPSSKPPRVFRHVDNSVGCLGGGDYPHPSILQGRGIVSESVVGHDGFGVV